MTHAIEASECAGPCAAMAAARDHFISKVERALEDSLHGASLLADAARHLCISPGAKRARPALCMLLGQVVGTPESTVVDIAAAVELVHSASLLHDDVIDASDVRRGRPTVNALHGNTVAVLTGDLVLSRALQRLVPHGAVCLEKAIDVVEEMTRAAFLEVQGRGDGAFPLEQWRSVAQGKTGALFGLCGCLAAVVAGDSTRAAAYDAAGRHLGVAFQIADDVGDLFDGPLQESFVDLAEQNPSYPVLLATSRSPRLRDRLIDVWRRPSAEAIAEIGREVRTSDAVPLALQHAASEVRQARAVLEPDLGHPAMVEVMVWAMLLTRHPRFDVERCLRVG